MTADHTTVSLLTDREEQVLDLLSYGYGVREIALALGITSWTAIKHRDNAVRKLEASTQTAAVAMLLRARATVGA